MFMDEFVNFHMSGVFRNGPFDLATYAHFLRLSSFRLTNLPAPAVFLA
jgi:hypothetical protein